jgi:signal transduction histidine kinase
MENGCKFSNNHFVKVRISSVEKEILLEFIDEGIGIPIAEQAFVFRPFYRASNAQQQTQGNGIGLALSARIIELHDGILSVQSSPQQGSIFEIQLPVEPDP